MERLTKEERRAIIKFNRENGNIVAEIINDTPFTHTSGGGRTVEKLPTMDEQEGTFNHDDTDDFDIR